MFCCLIYSSLNIGSQTLTRVKTPAGAVRFLSFPLSISCMDKYWLTLALKCSSLYFGGYAIVFGKQDDTCKPEG